MDDERRRYYRITRVRPQGGGGGGAAAIAIGADGAAARLRSGGGDGRMYGKPASRCLRGRRSRPSYCSVRWNRPPSRPEQQADRKRSTADLEVYPLGGPTMMLRALLPISRFLSRRVRREIERIFASAVATPGPLQLPRCGPRPSPIPSPLPSPLTGTSCARTWPTRCARCGRSPGFTATALAVTALCIGATTAAFSLADHVLLRPLPFPDPDRLVRVSEDDRQQGYGRLEASPGNFRDWRDRARSFSAMASYSYESMNLSGDGEPERLDGVAVGAGLLEIVGARPLAGRTFTPDEDAQGAAGTVILSDALWQRRYGGDRGVLGRTVLLNSTPYTVIGIMPADFAFPRRTTTFWIAQRFNDRDFTDRSNTYLYVLARLNARRHRHAGPRRNAPHRRTTGTRVAEGQRGHRRHGVHAAFGDRPAVARRCWRRWPGPRCASFSSVVPIWRTCCWRARSAGARNWRFARRSARGASG